MRVVGGAFLALTLTSIASASASAPSAGASAERWRVIGRGSDYGDLVAVAAAASKARSSPSAVRVRGWGRAKDTRARLHTVFTCSNAGFGISSRRETFVLWPSVVRTLRPPIGYPDHCGVTAIAEVIDRYFRRGGITVEILARCIVQWNGRCT
jgi:hypothetical protein